MEFDTRKYVIFATSEIDKVDFSQVMETSPETCRYSIDGTKTFIKYVGDQPISIRSIISKSQEYTHPEIVSILSTSEWTDSKPLI